jgi:hypothetical protein
MARIKVPNLINLQICILFCSTYLLLATSNVNLTKNYLVKKSASLVVAVAKRVAFQIVVVVKHYLVAEFVVAEAVRFADLPNWKYFHWNCYSELQQLPPAIILIILSFV